MLPSYLFVSSLLLSWLMHSHKQLQASRKKVKEGKMCKLIWECSIQCNPPGGLYPTSWSSCVIVTHWLVIIWSWNYLFTCIINLKQSSCNRRVIFSLLITELLTLISSTIDRSVFMKTNVFMCSYILSCSVTDDATFNSFLCYRKQLLK